MDTGPDIIGRYEIKGLLARGGMGRLYLARDPNTSRLVVLKLLDATLDSRDLRDRFDREARALASLSHPNIIGIYDYGDFQESPFIVMEYVRGETLEETIKRRAPLSAALKLKLMSELCAGLAHAHDAGIIHRDVKPANLMVDQDDRLKIIDFGIARVSGSSLTAVLTPAGLMQMQIGTPGYMSPEQTDGGDIDPRADIFAVGAVCYELFAYRPAFAGTTRKEIESAVMRTPPEPLAGRLADVTPGIDTVIARALARNRNDRYQDASSLLDAFEQCRTRLPAATTPVTFRRSSLPGAPAGGPPGSRAEAAYRRAMAASAEQALDLARRFSIEALAEDPDHEGARALLASLDPRRPPVRPSRSGPPASQRPAPTAASARPPAPRPPAARPVAVSRPEVVSTDPAALIDLAGTWPESETIEPTVVIRRPASAPRHEPRAETVVIPPPPQRSRAPIRPAAPTTPGKQPMSRSSGPAARGARPPSLWTRLKAFGNRTPSSPAARASQRGAGVALGRPASWSPTMRGAAVAVAALAAAALLVFGAVRGIRSLVPDTRLLTMDKPVGGTITGGGLSCGAKGSDCSSERPVGEVVDLQAESEQGYEFRGYTGPCTEVGRVRMTEARTCTPTFEAVAAKPSAIEWPLMITPSEGGTVLVSQAQIVCGTVDTRCNANLPDGQRVHLETQPEDGFSFVSYTGECDSNGETIMRGQRTCGATFMRTAPKPVAVASPPPPPRSSHSSAPVLPPPATPAAPTAPPPGTIGSAAPSGSGSTAGSGSSQPVETGGDPQKPAAPPISAAEHAKLEINQLLVRYCSAYESLKPEAVKKLFPRVVASDLRTEFKQYKTLKCTVTSPLTYTLLEPFDTGAAAAIKFTIKHDIEYKTQAPKALEMIVTMRLFRKDLHSDWIIDNADHVQKPKQ